MPKRLTYEFVKESFESEGYELLEDSYVNNKTKMKYKCSEGHEHSIMWGMWNNGVRCTYCAHNNQKHTIVYVKEQFEAEGYELLEDSYINNYTKMKYRCPEGHEHSMSWSSWNKGTRCVYCSGMIKPTIEFIRSEFTKEKYKLLTVKYINNEQRLHYICSEGHKHSITWGNFNKGKRCPVCAGNARLTIEFVTSEFEKEKYTLLSKAYINAFTKLYYICSEGHKHCITWNNFKKGERCPTCYENNNFGANTVGWKGGISLEPYCEIWKDQEFKADIRERDDNKCNNPYCWGTSDKLCIHHIDYDKKNCHPDNLITVCNSCNARANVNREWHTEFYKNIKQKSLEIGGY